MYFGRWGGEKKPWWAVWFGTAVTKTVLHPRTNLYFQISIQATHSHRWLGQSISDPLLTPAQNSYYERQMKSASYPSLPSRDVRWSSNIPCREAWLIGLHDGAAIPATAFIMDAQFAEVPKISKQDSARENEHGPLAVGALVTGGAFV